MSSGMGGRTCFALPRGPFRMSLMPGKARFTNFPKNVGVKRMSPADAVDVGAPVVRGGEKGEEEGEERGRKVGE